MFKDLSNKIELALFLITGFFAFLTEDYWIHWAVVSFTCLMILITDMIFFVDHTFIYDPDYNHWKQLSEPSDFNFKTD